MWNWDRWAAEFKKSRNLKQNITVKNSKNQFRTQKISPKEDSYHKDSNADPDEAESHSTNGPPGVSLQINLRYIITVFLDGIRQRAPRAHDALRLVARIHDLIGRAVKAVPTAALALDVLFGLTAFARKTANGLGRFWLLVLELDLIHVQVELTEFVFADFHPLVLAGRDLLEVDDVVASWTVAVVVKVELVAG